MYAPLRKGRNLASQPGPSFQDTVPPSSFLPPFSPALTHPLGEWAGEKGGSHVEPWATLLTASFLRRHLGHSLIFPSACPNSVPSLMSNSDILKKKKSPGLFFIFLSFFLYLGVLGLSTQDFCWVMWDLSL